jgi:type IV secretion system protein VirB9
MSRPLWLAIVASAAALVTNSTPGFSADTRLRSVEYDPETVYRLRGYVGFQIDLEFEPGESFIGLGAGDLDAVGYAAQDNHLFIKPRATRVRTNLTVLTSRRTYHFEYAVTSASAPEASASDLLFTLRFIYPSQPPAADAGPADDTAGTLERVAVPVNRDYWYCGSVTLQPLSAFDDGIGTHLRFSAGRELPAMFVQNDDGTESLLNFSVHDGEVVIHRVVQRLLVRRGSLHGCIVNRGFVGAGRELPSGTISGEVERAIRKPVHAP